MSSHYPLSPEAFISYIQKLIEELRLTGDNTTDAEIVTLLLKKIPSNYDACIQYYERFQEHEQTLERLTEEISKSYEIQEYWDPERFHVAGTVDKRDTSLESAKQNQSTHQEQDLENRTTQQVNEYWSSERQWVAKRKTGASPQHSIAG